MLIYETNNVAAANAFRAVQSYLTRSNISGLTLVTVEEVQLDSTQKYLTVDDGNFYNISQTKNILYIIEFGTIFEQLKFFCGSTSFEINEFHFQLFYFLIANPINGLDLVRNWAVNILIKTI